MLCTSKEVSHIVQAMRKKYPCIDGDHSSFLEDFEQWIQPQVKDLLESPRKKRDGLFCISSVMGPPSYIAMNTYHKHFRVMGYVRHDTSTFISETFIPEKQLSAVQNHSFSVSDIFSIQHPGESFPLKLAGMLDFTRKLAKEFYGIKMAGPRYTSIAGMEEAILLWKETNKSAWQKGWKSELCIPTGTLPLKKEYSYPEYSTFREVLTSFSTLPLADFLKNQFGISGLPDKIDLTDREVARKVIRHFLSETKQSPMYEV